MGFDCVEGKKKGNKTWEFDGLLCFQRSNGFARLCFTSPGSVEYYVARVEMMRRMIS